MQGAKCNGDVVLCGAVFECAKHCQSCSKGQKPSGCGGDSPTDTSAAPSAVFLRGAALKPQILFQQSSSKTIHNLCAIHILLQLCCQLGGLGRWEAPRRALWICRRARHVWFPPPVPAAPVTKLLFSVLPTITETSFLRDKSVIVVGSFLWCLFSQ